MTRALRIGIGTALVVAGVLAMGVLTRFQYGGEPDRAALRLAWRTPVPRIVECREPTAEELAELPVHMRRDEICEGRSVTYRLTVEVDGETRHRAGVRAEGARADRPLQVFEELRLEPGRRAVKVVFERADTVDGEEGGTAVPDRLVFDRTLRVDALDVVLITYDPDRRALVRTETSG